MFIGATPEQIWDAITKPEFTAQYFHGARIEITPRSGWLTFGPRRVRGLGRRRDAEWDPPRRLVHEWRSGYDPEMAAEEPSRVTWEIESQEGGCSKLT